MSGQDNYAFTDLNKDVQIDNEEDASTKDVDTKEPPGKGCYVSPAVVFIYILLAIAVSVSVGLIVHFTHPSGTCVCECPDRPAETAPPPTPDYNTTWELCLNMSMARNECLPTPPCSTEAPQPTFLPPDDEVPPGYMRLPTHFIPYHYNVEIWPDIYSTDPDDFKFNGTVDIYLDAAQENDTIFIHYRDMTIDNSSVRVTDADDPSTDKPVDSISLDKEKEFYIIKLSAMVSPPEKIRVTLNFEGPLQYDMQGMYWSTYLEAGVRKYMLATQFEATEAREAFPCLDEPQLKATFNISLARKGNMLALTNMPSISNDTTGTDWTVERFAKTSVVMPTYLIAFAIAEFDFVEDVADGGMTSKYLRYYARPEAVADNHLNVTVEVCGPMFDFFEAYFNHEYELPKYDSISIPDFSAGAMENWGLVTYRETRMLWDPLYSTQYEAQRLTGTMAHELLHMWIGNVVTCAWWSDIWLNEGFARYYQHWGMEAILPQWGVEQIYLGQSYLRFFAYDCCGSYHPIHNPVETPAEASAMFSAISYDKAGALIRMMHRLVFKDHFNETMQNYIQEFEHKNADHMDLLTTWDREYTDLGGKPLPGGVTITDTMLTWIKQSGFPLLTFSPQGSDMKVGQKLWLRDPQKPIKEYYPTPYDYKWEIPVEYVTSNNLTYPVRVWLHHDGEPITISPGLGDDDWILANYAATGLYRINYHLSNYGKLINQLNTDHTVIGYENRGQLIDDSFNLARSGDLDIKTAMDLTAYLSKEEEWLPWYAMEGALDYLIVMLFNRPDYGLLKEYVKKQLETNYNRLGWDISKDDPHTETYLRTLTLDMACFFEHQDCVMEASTLFEAWRANPNDLTIIKPDVREVVFCTAVKFGTANYVRSENWDFLFQYYNSTQWHGPDGTDRIRIRNALTCSRERWTLSRLFNLAAAGDDRIHRSDRASIMSIIARNPVGHSVAWDYLNEHWDNPAYGYGMSHLSTVSSRFSSAFEKEKLEKFMQDHPAGSYDQNESYNDMIRTVEANIRWQDSHSDDLIKWLHDHA